MSKVVLPKAMCARAVLVICAYLRNHAKSVLIAKKRGGDIDKFIRRNFEDLIYFKLKWLILITSLIMLLDSGRDNLRKLCSITLAITIFISSHRYASYSQT